MTKRILLFFLLISSSHLAFAQIEKWVQPEGVMSVTRSEGGVALIDGLMYFPGGYNNSANVMNTLEAYNPSTDSWTRLKDMPEALEHHVVNAVGNKMYVFKEKTHIYDPGTDEWSEGKATNRRDDPTSVVIGEDVYIVGGGSPALQKYNTTNDLWEDLTPMNHEVGHARAAYLNGNIYVTGGIPGSNNRQTDEVYVYNVQTNNWSQGISMQDVRSGHSIGVIAGKIIVAGGELGSPRQIITSVESFDPIIGKWTYLTEMPHGLHGTGYTVYENKLYILGGSKAPYWVDNDGKVLILDLGQPMGISDFRFNTIRSNQKSNTLDNHYNLLGKYISRVNNPSIQSGKKRNFQFLISVSSD